jgi:hypothetical protein
MNSFLLTHEVVIATTPTEDSRIPVRTIRLKVHSIMRAASVEEVNTRAVQHKYPGFVSQLINVLPIESSLSADQLYSLMNTDSVITEERI